VAQKLKTRSITGENQFTDPTEMVGYFNISISGTWAGTVTAQRAFDSGAAWLDVATWTTNTEEYGFEPERDVRYRVGIKEGNFTSGTCSVRLSQ
jgi:hypothetical protein